MTKPEAKIIPVDASARNRHGLRPPVFSEDAFARADEALEGMSGEFRQWLEAEVERLHAARAAARAARWGLASIETLAGAAHDIKGCGATYGFPILTQIAASLCRIVEADPATAQAEPDLVEAHVDAIRASLRENITSDAEPLGRALLAALDARVNALGLPPA